MELVKEFLSPKSFNPLSFVVVIVSLLTGIILLGVVADIENIETNEERYSFTCRIKGEEKQYFQANCFADYQAETTRGFPLYAFVLLYFLPVTLVCLIYSLSVKSRIEHLSERQDPETRQPNQSARLCCGYCIQLAVRFAIGILFLILQWVVFYPVFFPSEYTCDLSSNRHQAITKHASTTSGAENVTRFRYDCYNPQAGKKTFWTIVVFTVIVLVTVSVLVELIYIIYKAKVNENFKNDLEFFKIYLLNKPRPGAVNFSENMTHTNRIYSNEEMTDSNGIVLNSAEEMMDSSSIVENYVSEMKENVKKNTMFYESLLPNIPGVERKLLELDKISTNLIMYPGRAEYEFSGERHEINEGYLKSQERHESIKKLEEIFSPIAENPQKIPHSIMIIGRPGIGKSLLCLKILRDWACGKMFDEETETGKRFEYVCLFKFRHFSSDEKMNLRELLGRGQFSGSLPNEVYDWILGHPEKVLLIFDHDGLDEFGNKENIPREEAFDQEGKIPFSALYAKLTLGKILKGATVVTTSRPTALSYVSFPHKRFDRTLEVLGFSREQIEKYIERFCQDSNVYGKLWDRIQSKNLLSLCYIPMSCHILCFLFQERLKRDEVKNDEDYLPTTLTEIYEDALMVVCKHNPEYRCNVPKQEKLLDAKSEFSPEVEKSLKSLSKIAYQGIKEDRWIFESKEVKGHEESGLLHRLPNEKAGTIQHKEQHCFLHLTIQEFLAAKDIVAQLKVGNIQDPQRWISELLHQGKWEVVMQFVAGLLHDEDNSIITIFIESLPHPTTVQSSWPSSEEKGLALRLFKYIFEISRNPNNGWKNLVTKKLSGVVEVDLSWASLTDADLTSILFVLQEVKSIASLDVSRNHLTSIGCLEIHKLVKMLGSSDAHHGNESKLTTLDIGWNEIGDDGVKHLSKALSSNECQLTTLDISGNKIGDVGVKHLSDALYLNECQLTTLDISDNKIGDDGVKHLSGALSSNKCQLTTLNISGNKIGDVGVKHLTDALIKKKCKLTTLNISGNNIGDDGVKHLSDALTTKECQLTSLNISGNNIGDVGVKHLSDALTTKECQLTTLNISGNKIGDVGVKHLSDALIKKKCKLTTLNISGNNIGDLGVKHLSDALIKKKCKLTTLNISGNNIGDVGVKHLSDALIKKKCKLTTLNISGNNIGDVGVKHLSDALTTKECKLTTLNISGNKIGDVGVKHLADALTTKECKLTTLNISGNKIGDVGVKHLADALIKKKCKLTSLNISGNNIGDDGAKHLSDALTTNKCQLTTLDISDNNIGLNGVLQLSAALSSVSIFCLLSD